MTKEKTKFSVILPIAIAVVAVVAIIAVIFVPKLVHECDNCGETFVGTGYEPSILSDAVEFFGGEGEQIICEECAAREHALAIFAGRTLDDYKLPLFE